MNTKKIKELMNTDNEKNSKIHEAIQNLLTKFKKTSGNEKFPFHFKSNPNVYVVEGQIPDIWLKTRKPFDKNLCFVIEKHKQLNMNSMETKEITNNNIYPQ